MAVENPDHYTRHMFFGRILPTALFAFLALSNLMTALKEQDNGGLPVIYHLLSAGLWVLFLIMVQIRAKSLHSNRAPLAVAVALGASFITIPLSISGTASGPRLVFANVLLLGGMAFSVVAVATLGKCFGVLADARGLVTTGPYQLVRHPLYLGELVTMLGLALGAEHLFVTLPTWIVMISIQAVRSRYEERTLAAAFPLYLEYARSVPYRIVPGVY